MSLIHQTTRVTLLPTKYGISSLATFRSRLESDLVAAELLGEMEYVRLNYFVHPSIAGEVMANSLRWYRAERVHFLVMPEGLTAEEVQSFLTQRDGSTMLRSSHSLQ